MYSPISTFISKLINLFYLTILFQNLFHIFSQFYFKTYFTFFHNFISKFISKLYAKKWLACVIYVAKLHVDIGLANGPFYRQSPWKNASLSRPYVWCCHLYRRPHLVRLLLWGVRNFNSRTFTSVL